MMTFWAAIATLFAVALGFLVYPFWRQRRLSGRWSLSGLAAVALTVPLALGVYYTIRTYDPAAEARRSQQLQILEEFAQRLKANPDNVQGWRMLGQYYSKLELYDRALAAYKQAFEHSPAPDDGLKLDYAEAQVLVDQTALAGKAGELIDEVLADDPNNARALWYGGERALAIGRNDLARTRLTRLLQLGVPDQIAQIAHNQLEQLGAAGASAGGSGAGGSGAGAGGPQSAAAASGPSVRIKVRLGEDLASRKLDPSENLYIFARTGAGGPPVAVMRQPVSAIPGEFVLSDANAMIPGRSLGDFPELTLVARIGRQPTASPGDLYAEMAYHPGKDKTAELVIDKVQQ